MITFKIIEDPTEAKRLWELFSPHKRIDDEWEFRNTWTEDYNFPFHFIVGYDGEKPVGLLPLQYNTLKGLGPKLLNVTVPYLEFFAGIDTDDNDVWVLPGYEKYKVDFFRQITRPAILSPLKEQYTIDTVEAAHYIDRFELSLEKNPDMDTYLQQSFDAKGRSRLKGRVKKLCKTYNVTTRVGTEQDLDVFFNFNISHFGNQSSFNMADRQSVYRTLFKKFQTDIVVVELDGQIKAVTFGLLYKDIYTAVNLGYDDSIRDLFKVLVYMRIERAQELGYKLYDVGKGDNGWKSHFHFTKIPQYQLILNM